MSGWWVTEGDDRHVCACKGALSKRELLCYCQCSHLVYEYMNKEDFWKPTQRWAGSFPLWSILHGGSAEFVHLGDESDKADPLSRCPALRTPSAHHPQKSCNDVSVFSPGACLSPGTPATKDRNLWMFVNYLNSKRNTPDDIKTWGLLLFGLIIHSSNDDAHTHTRCMRTFVWSAICFIH